MDLIEYPKEEQDLLQEMASTLLAAEVLKVVPVENPMEDLKDQLELEQVLVIGWLLVSQ